MTNITDASVSPESSLSSYDTANFILIHYFECIFVFVFILFCKCIHNMYLCTFICIWKAYLSCMLSYLRFLKLHPLFRDFWHMQGICVFEQHLLETRPGHRKVETSQTSELDMALKLFKNFINLEFC